MWPGSIYCRINLNLCRFIGSAFATDGLHSSHRTEQQLNMKALKEHTEEKCNEVMTENIVCCQPDYLVEKVAQLMQSENVGSIP
jgi:signal-transduction protein with cAMP-binding, CBS, and nucleotidyltransferase domain